MTAMNDVLWYDDSARTAYRITVRAMTIADGIAAETLQDEIARREGIGGRLLLRLMDYALLRHATARAERAVFSEPPPVADDGTPQLPDDADWQPLELTEETFLALPEWLFWLWWTAFVNRNPQYDRSYEALKKNATLAKPMNASMNSSSESASGESASATISSDG